MEPSGLRGSIRLVKVALTNEFSGQTDPRGPETDQNGTKSPKTDQKTGKPLAPISLAGPYVSVSRCLLAQPPQRQAAANRDPEDVSVVYLYVNKACCLQGTWQMETGETLYPIDPAGPLERPPLYLT